MKNLILLLMLLGLPFSVSSQDKMEISIAYNYMTESGNLYFWEADTYYFVGDTHLVKVEFSYFFGSFGLGIYGNTGTPWYDGFEETRMVEIGPAFKYRITFDKISIVPTLYLGYRSYAGVAGNGMGLNFSLIGQYQLEKFAPFLDIGFMSQPVGGNDATNITFGPVFNIGAGVSMAL